MENSVELLQSYHIYAPAIPLLDEEIEIRISNRHLHFYIHNSIIHNSHNIETT